MAVYTTIDDPSAYFKVQLYTGGGGTQSITFDDTDTDMQPDLVWIKDRADTFAHQVHDSVRGASAGYLSTDSTGTEQSSYPISSFNSDGWTTKSGGTDGQNVSGDAFVSWNWKASGSTASNSTGDLTSTVSANTTSKFSIVSWTAADAGAAKTVGHGLGVVPEFIIVKQRNRTINWICYIEAINNTNTMWLDTADPSSDVDYWNDTSPTTSLFTTNGVLEDAYNLIAYCFASVQGFSKFGKYIGNGNANGTFVYTGFRPAWIMIKYTGSGESWIIHDNKRNGFNNDNDFLYANTTGAEVSGTHLDILSNGFKARSTNGVVNGSGTYTYMAFAEAPFVNSNGVPCNAR